MRSALPKVLHEVCGRPSLWHVLAAARAVRPARLIVVVSHGADEVEDSVRSWKLRPEPLFVDQGVPHGTGHAVMAVEDAVQDVDDVLVLAGDDPLVTGEHVRELLKTHRRTKAAATILTTFLVDPTGYGRVMREGDRLIEIVEEAEATPRVRRIREVSTLVYAFRREDLFRALPLLGRDNRQHEYYLPEVLAILRDKGEKVSAVPVDFGGALGLNSRRGLAKVGQILRERVVERHMAHGVTFVDPATAYIDTEVKIGRDSVIEPMTYLEGSTRIGVGCRIGPNTRIVDSAIGDGTEVTFAVIRESRIGPRASIGPYASIRPGTIIEEGGKAGTFVEVKASRIGKGSKVPHLSYVGDTRIGRGTNIGAATVTVNYDGFDKHRTVIGDEVHIGSDTMLVAPVRIGKRSWTGAGSVITRDVPAGALAVERAEQRNVTGYDERKRKARGRKTESAGAGPGAATKGESKPERRGGRSRG